MTALIKDANQTYLRGLPELDDLPKDETRRRSALNRFAVARAEWILAQYKQLSMTGRLRPTWSAIHCDKFPDRRDHSVTADEIAQMVTDELEYVCEPYPTDMYLFQNVRSMEFFDDDYEEYVHQLTVDQLLLEACCTLYGMTENDDHTPKPKRAMTLGYFEEIKLTILTGSVLACRDSETVLDFADPLADTIAIMAARILPPHVCHMIARKCPMYAYKINQMM